MKGIMDELDQRKELFDLINFYCAKLVQVKGCLLEVDRTNLTCMLCTLHGVNTCFSDIVKLEFVKNIIRGSNLVPQFFGGKFHHCCDFFQKTVREFKGGNNYNLATMIQLRCYSWPVVLNREIFLV